MDWLPRVEYGTATLDFTLPQRPWSPASHAVGGRDISATGVPAAYSVRRDELLDVTIRCWEHEWPAVRAWLVWAQHQAPFDWFPDQNEVAWYECYLHEPAMGEPIRPERDAEFPLVFELAIQLRTTQAEPFVDIYFRDD